MEIQGRQTTVSIPELALIAGTRALIGAGLGLLLADRLSPEQRKAVGWTLLGIGAVSTVPIGFEVFGGRRLKKQQQQAVLHPPAQNSQSIHEGSVDRQELI